MMAIAIKATWALQKSREENFKLEVVSRDASLVSKTLLLHKQHGNFNPTYIFNFTVTSPDFIKTQ